MLPKKKYAYIFGKIIAYYMSHDVYKVSGYPFICKLEMEKEGKKAKKKRKGRGR